MTEQMVLEEGVIELLMHEAMNDGIMAAVQMVRIAAQKHPEWSFDQLANCIEATVTKDKA